MEERVGPFTFFSNFDSGNLARVERVKLEENPPSPEDDGTVVISPDYDYNVWTAPDCAGMEGENANRTWFYFGVKGSQQGKLLRINIMNLNRQGKLYGQGMTPLVKVVPTRNKWERIRDKPKYETVDGQFRLSFTYRFPDQRNAVHYFAFCYPYSYSECQSKLEELDRSFKCQPMTLSSPNDAIYYHRELLCYSLDNLRVDLLTVTSAKGMTDKREDCLPHLFPDKTVPRAHVFQGKKVFFLSARVHPGETPSSFVFNGFLDFILRKDDPRAVVLRNHYVFKMIPMLNPDGVKRGHYRTDSRGTNLNRVYLEPDPLLHPTIFAAKSIVMYHHIHGDVNQMLDAGNACRSHLDEHHEDVNDSIADFAIENDISDVVLLHTELKPGSPDAESVKMELQNITCKTVKEADDENNNKDKHRGLLLSEDVSVLQVEKSVLLSSSEIDSSSNETHQEKSVVNGLSKDSTSSILSEGLSQYPANNNPLKNSLVGMLQSETSKVGKCLPKTSNDMNSGVAYYVDLHGHASKRGCFVYANYLENEDNYVSSVLFPKLISLNSANFDFSACNFTEKNMYSKDKRDGSSKEGSGRVAIYKATGIVHCYTLECNYNCGRTVNCLPPATCDSGRATPPPAPGFPPKYTQEIYEEVGRALAVAVLDMNNSNPWTRLPLSEFSSLDSVRNWVKRFIKSSKNAPSLPKKLSRIVTRTSSLVAGATAGTRQKLSALTSSSSDMSSDSAVVNGGNQMTETHPSQNVKGTVKEAGKKSSIETGLLKRPLNLAATRRSMIKGTGNMIGGKNQECFSSCGGLQTASSKEHLPESGSLRPHVYKTKEQPRVSLELPKTGPTLRLVHNLRHQPQINVQCLPPSNKTLSPSIEIKMRGKASTSSPSVNCPVSNHSDDERKKKSHRQRKKNGRKKEKVGEAPLLVSSTQVFLPRPFDEEAPDSNQAAYKDDDDDDEKSKGPQLSRQNSSKKLISCNMTSCGVVDIKELPRSPQKATTNSPLSVWNNSFVS